MIATSDPAGTAIPPSAPFTSVSMLPIAKPLLGTDESITDESLTGNTVPAARLCEVGCITGAAG